MRYVYCLRNRVVGAYENPVVNVADKDEAVKAYRYVCLMDRENAIRNHYQECELYLFGTFDEVTGHLDLHDPEFLVSLDQFFPKEKADGKED